MQTSNGHFQVRIVGTRIFRILQAGLCRGLMQKCRDFHGISWVAGDDPGASQASQHQDGYILATVNYPSMEDQAPAPEDVDIEEMLKDLKDWQVRWGAWLSWLVQRLQRA